MVAAIYLPPSANDYKMHKALNRVACSVAFLCPFASPRAEPGPVVQWLIKQPMSLFDWGLYKTDKKMADLRQAQVYSADFFHGTVDYDWDANRIRLQVSFVGKGTDAECVEHIKLAKAVFLNYTWNERDHAKVAPEVFSALFSHEGYKSKNEPADMGQQLVNMSLLEATIYVRSETGGTSFAPRARCSTDFKSASVKVVK